MGVVTMATNPNAPCPRCNQLGLLAAAGGESMCRRCGWDSSLADALIEADLAEGGGKPHPLPPGMTPYEYYFAPNGQSARQDAARARGGAAGSATHRDRSRRRRRLGK